MNYFWLTKRVLKRKGFLFEIDSGKLSGKRIYLLQKIFVLFALVTHRECKKPWRTWNDWNYRVWMTATNLLLHLPLVSWKSTETSLFPGFYGNQDLIFCRFWSNEFSINTCLKQKETDISTTRTKGWFFVNKPLLQVKLCFSQGLIIMGSLNRYFFEICFSTVLCFWKFH